MDVELRGRTDEKATEKCFCGGNSTNDVSLRGDEDIWKQERERLIM